MLLKRARDCAALADSLQRRCHLLVWFAQTCTARPANMELRSQPASCHEASLEIASGFVRWLLEKLSVADETRHARVVAAILDGVGFPLNLSQSS